MAINNLRPPTPPEKAWYQQICPHMHFRADVIDRNILSKKQHLNLLCTPKGYRWEVFRKADGTIPDAPKPVFICSDRRKKSGKTYVHNFLAEIWSLLTPEMIEHLKEILMAEFGMTAEESVRFICEQRVRTLQIAQPPDKGQDNEEEDDQVEEGVDPRLPRVIFEDRLCDKSEFALGIDPCEVREFSRIVANKLSEYVMSMMCVKRNHRHRRMAEVILNGLCNATGEKCTLDNPKNRLHKILTLTSDRCALWLAQNIPDEDKIRQLERQKEDAMIRKKKSEKMKDRENRKKEHDKMDKEREKQEKKKAKKEEEDAKKKKEEDDKKKEEKEKRHKELEENRKKQAEKDKKDKDKKDKDKKDKGDGDKKGGGDKKDGGDKGGSKGGAAGKPKGGKGGGAKSDAKKSGDNKAGAKDAKDARSGGSAKPAGSRTATKPAGDKKPGDKKPGDKKAGDKQAGSKPTGNKPASSQQKRENKEQPNKPQSKPPGDKKPDEKGADKNEDEKGAEAEADEDKVDDVTGADEKGGEDKGADDDRGDVESKADEKVAEEKKADEKTADEKKAEEKKADEKKAEEKKADEKKADEVKADEVKADEVKADEVKADEVKADQVKADEVKADEVKADEEKADEKKADEKKAEENKSDEKKTDEKKADEEKADVDKVDDESVADKKKGSPDEEAKQTAEEKRVEVEKPVEAESTDEKPTDTDKPTQKEEDTGKPPDAVAADKQPSKDELLEEPAKKPTETITDEKPAETTADQAAISKPEEEKDKPPSAVPSETKKFVESTVSQISATEPVSTPRQEAIKDIISKELSARIQPKDEETKEVIKEMSDKTATWVDQKVKIVEEEYGKRDQKPPITQKPKGPIFKVKPSDDHLNVTMASHLEAEQRIRESRGKTTGGIDANKPMSPDDAKMWAKWAKDASQMAEDWGKWIDKTIQDAEDKTVLYRSKGKESGKEIDVDKEDWERFAGKTLEEALEWRRNRRALEETASMWSKKTGK